MSRDLADVRLAALMVDGIELKSRCCIVALGVSTDGVKLPLGLWDGPTENKTVTAHLLADLVSRGLDVEQGVLVVLDAARRSGRPSMRSSACPGAALYPPQGTLPRR
jgi:putative transposase